MKEKKQTKQVNDSKKKITLNKKTLVIGTIAIFAIACIVGVFTLNKNNDLANLSPELARSMTYDQVQPGDESINGTNGNVSFDAFFLRDLNGDGDAEGIRGTCNPIGGEDTLYMELNVSTGGYLRDGKIIINSNNFYLQTNLPKDDQLADNYVGNNIKEIELNDINNGAQKLIMGIVRSGNYSTASQKTAAIGNNINNYSKVNTITFTGTYVGSSGEVQISKTVDLTVDWYATTRTEIPTYINTVKNLNQEQDISTAIDETNNTFTIEFKAGIQEVNNELILSKAYIEGEIPELQGYAPTNVEISGTNVTYTYDEQTRKFTAQRDAVVDSTGRITSQAYDSAYTSGGNYYRYNKFTVRVTYPLDAYRAVGADTVEYRLPITAHYEGYNNPNSEFTNPYISNTAQATFLTMIKEPSGSVAIFDVKVGKYLRQTEDYEYIVSKQKPLRMYNGQSDTEQEDRYEVRWYVTTGTNGNTSGIVMKETRNGYSQVSDQFVKTNGQEESMENVTTNAGIYFTGAGSLLNSDGWIKVYDDETNNLIATFTSDNWSNYTSSNPYIYETPVKHVRIETSATNASSYMYAYNVKELNDEYITTNYTREQFDELQNIKSTVTGYVGTNYVNTDIAQASYEAPYSIAEITITNNTLSTQTTEENDIIRISTLTSQGEAYHDRWQNGTFLIKLPDSILTAEINNVQISNQEVSLVSYELIEENGEIFIKVVTSNDTPQTFTISIDVDLTPDPRSITTTQNIELYASNENASDYYYRANDTYDVNNNLNTAEVVNYTTASLSVVAPNSLLTSQTASNYDDSGNTVVSPQIADIRPQYAVVDEEEQTVKVGVQIKNNYSSTISEIQILGNIPFQGNTYVINGEDLGSTYTTTMNEGGIELPANLQNIAKVYYSTNEKPDRDLSNSANDWKTADQVTNWDEIKTYLIDLGSYVMSLGEEDIFYYTITLPEGLEFNQVAYSHHAVYFALDTDAGKYRTQTEPNKLGFRIAEKYNLEITKYQIDTDKVIAGATYSVKDVETGESKTAVTNASGILTISKLYAEKTYEISEIRTPEEYELNTNIITITAHVDDSGNLSVDKNGTTRGEAQVVKNEGENYKVTISVEDEVKANVKIVKKEQGSGSLLEGVRYKITGYGLPEAGRTVRTNSNGETTITGISVGQEYTLEEVKADGYYLASPIIFKVENNNGTYSLQVIQGTLTSQSLTMEDEIPTVNFSMEDEKIPTYNLQIIKIKRITDSTLSADELIAKAESSIQDPEIEYIEGAKFKLYKGEEEIGTYTTTADGRINIEGLYQYVSTKDVDQTYTLKEVLAPSGYGKVQDISFRVQEEDGSLVLIDENGEERKYTVDGDTVKLIVEDSPSFRLVKKDQDTQEVLANVKFALYNVDGDVEEPARNSKGEIIGTLETINGKQYYTVTTDESGEITADLPEGLYKAIEVETLEGYEENTRSYYFGIGKSAELDTEMKVVEEKIISRNSTASSRWGEHKTITTKDGGSVTIGNFQGTITIGNFELESLGELDILIVKYDNYGGVEWAKSIGGTGTEYSNSIIETADNGFVLVGTFEGAITVNNDTFNANGASDIIVIKLSKDGEIEWTQIAGSFRIDYGKGVVETADEGIIVAGEFESDLIINGSTVLSSNNNSDDIVLIKYNKQGNVIWQKSFGGSEDEEIFNMKKIGEKIYITGDYLSEELTVGNYILNSDGTRKGMIIECDENGDVTWATSIDCWSATNISEGAEDGFIVGGIYQESFTIGDYELVGDGNLYNGFIAKFDSNYNVEWTTKIELNLRGYNGNNVYVTTTNNGYAITGLYDNTITLGNTSLTGEHSNNSFAAQIDNEGNILWATSVAPDKNINVSSICTDQNNNLIICGIIRDIGEESILTVKYGKVTTDAVSITDARTVGGSGSDAINTIAKTSDGGYVAGGSFSGTIQIGNYEVTSQGSTDGILIKYDASNNVEWAKTFGGTGAENINKVIQTDDEGFIITGNFKTSGLVIGNDIYENYGGSDGIVIKYDKNGNIEWSSNIAKNSNDDMFDVVQANDGSYIVVGKFFSISNAENPKLDYMEMIISNEKITTTRPVGGIIIRYNLNGKIEWYEQHYSVTSTNSIVMLNDGSYIVGGYFNYYIYIGDQRIDATYPNSGYIAKYNSDNTLLWVKDYGTSGGVARTQSLAKMEDDSIIVSGHFSKDITLGSHNLVNAGNYDSMLFKINKDGEITWATSLGGTEDDNIYKVTPTSDGGFIVAGFFDSDSITAGGYTVTKGGSMSGIAIKYDSEQNVEWAIGIPGNNITYINAVESISDTKYLLGGYFSGSLVTGENNISSNGGNDGAIIEIENKVGVPEVQELSITNQKQEFEITTEAHGSGTVSGTDMSPYETVKYGEDSTQSIVIRPNSYNEIASITVNGELYAFTPSYDGTYTMPLFTDVKEDIHVVVNFVSTYNKYTIHKVDEYTREPIEGAKFSIQLRDSDSSQEVITDANGNAVVELSYGTYTITEIETPEGYEPNDTPTQITFNAYSSNEVTITNKPIAKVTVHHYLKDDSGRYTTTKVAEDDILTGKEGDTYTATPHLDLAEYELEKDSNGAYILPDDSTGTFSSAEKEIIFYYETKSIPLTVHHYIEGTQEQVELRDGTKAEDEIYSGKEGNSYSTEALTQQELSDKYELVETPANASGTYELPEVEVTYFYKVKEFNITTAVEGQGGSITGQNESPYEVVKYGENSTKQIIITPEENYQVKEITVNGMPQEFEKEEDGTVILDQFTNVTENKNIIVSFEKIPATVIVHHYIENTTTRVPSINGGVVADETKSGVVGDMYVSKESDDVQPNYEYVSSTNNTSGTMTKDTIEVIYYYRMKQAGIEQSIDKTSSPATITQEDQQLTYNITYTGKVTDYIGKASITITDILPYEIDQAKSKLDGGLYNDASNTITWTIDKENIDTYTNAESGNISITKQITVVYTNMDYSKTSFDNNIQASIELEATSQEEGPVEDTVTTNTDFRTQVTVTKVWNHTNNIYTIPTQVELQVKNGNNVVARQVVNSSNKVGDDENTWSYTFTGLTKYDSQGQPINYTVDETEVTPGDLDYYSKNISGNTITNTYNGPIISGKKEVRTENGLSYVVEGEKITYTITVKNDGGVSKDVQIKDAIPTGTSFVENSIKINNQEQTYTQTELQNGITVNVPEHGQTTISFDVTVNELTENTFTGTIKNTAYVDGDPTEEITNTVNKPNVEISKSSDPASGENVENGEEITYIIGLDNSTGTAPTTVKVKDTVPTETTFVRGSIKVGTEEKPELTLDNLQQGIDVELQAGESKNLEFKVRVNDLENGTEIRNVATVDEETTNEVTHTYVEPIISAEKESTTENSLNYVVEGEKITYTITITNDGDLRKDVTVTDEIPEGTSFVEGSIKVNNSSTQDTQTNLKNGITVPVEARGEGTLSFDVTVNELPENTFEKDIINIAYVDGEATEEVTETVNKPNVEISKSSNPTSGETVENGEEITYAITLDNSKGTAPEVVNVKDSIPTGTTFVDGSIKIGNDLRTDLNADNLAQGIDVDLLAGESKNLEFKVRVNDLENNTQIRNIATVDDEPTNETTHTYVEPIIIAEKESTTENNLAYAVEGEKITYTITVQNDGGLSKNVQIQDNIPEGTSFVEGSIKVNDSTTQDTEATLASGIQVNVPAYGESTLSFEVTVNELTDGSLTKVIRNTATVDGTPTEEITNTVNKADVKYSKSSDPASGETVVAGQEITYAITLDNSQGTAPAAVNVKDTIPLGTTFVEGSIKVGNEERTDLNADSLASGISVDLNARETKNVEFKVRVNDLENNAKIENVATVNDIETNKTTHTYIEPIISGSKSLATENSLDYVVEGEKITYIITVKNDGGLADDVQIQDEVPEGTSFVAGSIQISNNPNTTNLGASDLASGITVNVPGYREETLSFQVTVNELPTDTYQSTIRNTATLDGTPTNEVLDTVNKPNIEISKSASPANGNVIAGQEITYTITLDNSTGTAPTTVNVKDNIPEGTTFVNGSIKVGGLATKNTAETLASGINVDVLAGETKTVEFKVTVNDLNNNTQIRNIATVDNETTNEVTHTYVEPIISAEKESATQFGLDYAVEGEKITYTITIKNDGGLAKEVDVIDNIPEGTTFVDGSIKISNNPDTANLRGQDLENGIKVEVPEYGQATLSFDVTVDELPANTYESTIRNIAIVDETNTDEITETVNKPNVEISKSANPANGNVIAGQEITYTITLNNTTGTAPTTVNVKDNIPTETTFVDGSIKVGDESRTELNADSLAQGIDVDLQAGENKTVEFKVRVNDINNNTQIRNIATVDDEPTNETIHTYVEPIISQEKESATENNLAYVVEGEKITYTITVTNDGDLAKNVVVIDTIPEGTSFVDGSVKVNNSATQDTEDTLVSGITVPVSARGESTLSFEVTVDELTDGSLTKVIRNTATVDGTDTNEVTDTVNKSDVKFSKSSDPASGNTVVAGQEITYYITLDNSQGTAPAIVNVKDTIPTGTTFVEGSIKVGNEERTDLNADSLARGISVDLNAKETKNIEFKVRVNDLEDNTKIENVATVNDTETNKTTHTYVEPVISAIKSAETENGLAYVVEGERITYTITVNNDGGLADDVQIQDNIPEGTNFVDGSVKVNGGATADTSDTLASGIQVNVPAYGEATLSFEVTVDELTEGLTKVIRNTATVDGEPTNEVTDTVNKSDVKFSKASEPDAGSQVRAGQEITYYITLDNSQGTAPEAVNVKDTIPTGTTFVAESIKVGNEERTELTSENLANGIDVELQAGESKTVEFKVTVNDLVDNTTIENVATVNDTETNKTTHTYVKPIISAEKAVNTENSLNYAVEGEKLTYTITVKNDGGLATDVQIKDTIPTGTSFVENSIKVDNEEQTYTQTDLQNGITVNAPAYGEVTITFEVTVNEITDGTFTKEITNQAVVDETPTNEVKVTVNKPNVEASKSADPANGNVIAGQEITYIIALDNRLGTAPDTVTVKDTIPAGTSFVEGSIKVGEEARTDLNADSLAQGIDVDLQAGESKNLEFKVRVNDLDNNTQIRNIATVDDEPTNEITHTYIEPIISQEKESVTENNLAYVVEGEKITYTITVTNDGDLAKNVVVTDTIPEGTSFVAGSIKVNGAITADTSDTLASGITVPVSARGESTLSFEVTVDELTDGSLTKVIRNTATVDGEPTEEVTDTVNKSDVKYSKSSEPASGSTVVAGQEITYYITLDNSLGTAPSTVNVKDTIPAGTTFVEESIKVGGLATGDSAENLASGISVDLSAGETKTVEFKVRVNDLENNAKIDNIATVDEVPTNKITHTYVEPIISGSKSAETENGLAYVVEGEKITYTITVKNDGGLEDNVQIQDNIPAGTSFVDGSIRISNNADTLDLGESNLANGITVNVPAYGNTTLSFDVTVDKLPAETYDREIKNTAFVDGEPTDEITEIVNKPNVQISKTAEPQSGTKVITNNEITYTITLDNSIGTAPTTVTAQDTIPTGTTFIEGSIKVGGSATENTAEELASGISVDLNAGETKTVEFKVKVNELADNTEIRNVATVDGKETEPVIHTYVKPIISSTKSQATENGEEYVLEGETITYTITVKNDGGYAKDVIVTDEIPEGTTLVAESVKIDGRQITELEGNLSSGITVNVQPHTSKEVTFEVTVNELTGDTLREEISNTATVDEELTNEVTTEVRKPNVEISKSADPANGNVIAGQEITYTITLDNSTGTAPTTVIVKDIIPEGTTFVDESVKVGNIATNDTADTLASGISVDLQAGETKTVEFKVTVKDLSNGTQIRNVATVDDEPTNEIEHTYVEPIISAEKESATENNLPYVVEGEKITYTITIKNDGDLAKNVVVKDTIPDGTSFVTGSIKVNNETTADTQSSLNSGITVPVSARGEATISFEVTVNEFTNGLLTKEITNVAIVDGTPTDEVKETVNKPNVEISKSASPANGNVIAGQEITYTITLDNSTGTAPTTVNVKDTIPEGTTFVEGSIKVGNIATNDTAGTLASGISVDLQAGETKTVEFKVTVKDLSNGTQIRNVATVDDEPTNEIEHTYVEPIISAEKESATENNLPYVVEGEKITYTITIKNDGDLAKNVVVKDTIPEGTSFVAGSIKVNGGATADTSDTLASGITVPVAERGESTLSFEVTVDELTDGALTKVIRNTATVDGTPTEEITNTVNKSDVKYSKSSIPANGEEVEVGDEITYTITLDNSTGRAPATVNVKDTIPTGTSFVTGSIRVGETATESTAEELASGISVDLNAGETKNVEFKVTVNDIENGTPIRNVATVDDEPTNETTHTYVESIISESKSAETENGLAYVVEGEKITYTITIKNDGDLAKDVTVKDTIPEGTTFVDDSISIVENGTAKEVTFTKDDLEGGIVINVGAQNETSLTFQVTVNELTGGTYEYTIRNTATVDGNNTNEVTNEVNKAYVRIGKTSEPGTGEKVTANDEIRYVIVLENTEGTAPTTLTVKDIIPTGTTFVENSIRVNDIDLQNSLEDLTTNGINVLVPVGQTSTVEFKVKVQDLDNGYIIRNKASVENPETQEIKETNEVTHEYVEAIIEANKEMTTERNLSYVIPGETITYTIRIRNTGDLSKKITVSDRVPQGTEFVEGSVLLNGTPSNVTKEQLESGIEVDVGDTEQTISFEVTVLEGATEIKNTATVDGENTNETKVPVISYEKTAEVIRQTEENIAEGTVTAGDKIKYTIRINNLGEDPVTDVTIKDIVPTGTTLSKIYNSGITNDKNEITWTIERIEGNESLDVSFEVTVNYDVIENKNITNVATVDGEETNEVETPYDKPEIKEESTIEKTGTEKVTSTEDEISYKITYTASIKDFVGEGKVTIVDYLPYEIDIENQYLDGGFYDAKTKTITWEQDLGTIDTYINGDKTVTLEKEITVKYLYGEDAETLEGTIPNRVEGTLQLTQEDPENPLQDKTVLEDKKEATHETEVQIPTYIIVHHYIEGTNIKVPSKVYGEVVEDETQEGFVGQDYTTSASSNVQENYQVVSNSGNTTGSMTRTPIEVIYYYRLQPGNIVTNTITKDGTDKIVNKDDKVSYTLTYTGRITNYVGNAKVEIIDYLPFAIDESLSNLNGGLYNPANRTITWTEDLGRVNTYTDGPKDISLSKNIEVVFTEMNYNGTSFINRAQGKITLEETNQEQETPEASKETETEFIKDITVEKVWDDNEDIKGRRPDSVTVQLTADGNTIYNDQELEKVILSEENSWTYTFQDLPKYTEQGQEISYSVLETETNPGDLEYYENANIEVFNTDTTATVRVTNSYKLMDTNLDSKIEKTGTELVTSSSQEVNYNIKYNATVTEYIGTGLVTITDYLPYAIDVEKSELDGGTYDSLSNTITWTQNIDHINTYTDGDYQVSIEKNISIVFTNLDATAKAMVNRVTGRINLYENETTNTVETTYETKIEIPGNVIVKYVDRNTGVEIAEGYELKGLAGDSYRTELKDIYGYTFVESTNNTSGNMIEGTIEVIYYYERTNAGGVIVHYVDEEGNKLADDVTITGKVADPYRTEQKDIPNYDFVRVEGQTEGELIEGTIEVTYIYKKIPARVIVQHLEKDDTPDDNTDNVVLAEEEIIEGFSGDAYSTARKEIENYKPADPEPENAEGTMTREDIYVTYYYERKPSGIVTVKYVDVDTNEEILRKVELPDGSEEYTSYREQMSGLCGLEYTTEQKDIPYYNFVEDLRPSNATGIYTEEDIEVIYYYRKQTFNLSVEKLIDRITVNGAEHSLKDGLDQIDVVASKVQETDIVVTYKIVVSNPSEIAGTARVIESIPDFFRVTDGTSAEWTENGKSLNATVELQPGETKELTVVLRWIKNSNNFGLQVNTVTLQKVENPANYEETDLSDNTSIAEVLLSVKTGGIDTSIVIGTALVVMLGALMITIYLKEKKRK